MVKLFKVLPALCLATLSAAQLTITAPSSSIWWVAQSQNVLSWTCNTSPESGFTVLITNPSSSLFPAAAPLAFIAIQNNYQCSIVITQDESNQPAGDGWQILFADPGNNTNVYASSEPFEIKPLGSAYPSQVSPSASGASGTATGSGSTASSTSTSKKSGAVGMRTIGMGGFGAALAGLAAFLA